MIAVEFYKIAKLSDRVVNGARKLMQYSDGVTGQEEGLKGLNRFRQKLKGDLARKYFDQYKNMPAGADKEQMIRKLVDEDTETLMSRLHAGTGAAVGGMGAMYGAGRLFDKAVGGVASLARKGIGGNDKINEIEDDYTRAQKQYQEIEGKLPGLGGKALREVAERMGPSKLTNKITYEDTMPIPAQAALSAGTLGLTGKTMAANLLGAQTFYHGTHKNNVDSIMQNGIDPAYGGIEGGGAWRISQKGQAAKDMLAKIDEAYAQGKGSPALHKQIIQEYGYKLKNVLRPDEHKDFMNNKIVDHAAYDIKPKMKLMGIDRNIPMDTTDFLANAKGNSFVAKGLPGRLAATYYGRVTDPSAMEGLNKLVEQSAQKFEPKIRRAGTPMGTLRNFGYSLFKMPIDMVTEGKKYYDTLAAPKDTNVVGGVLPQEIFDKQFVRDPDDVTRMQTGYKTQTKIDPKNLAKNEVSLGQIFKNRTKHFGKYVKNNPGKFMSGLGLLGLNAAMTGGTGYSLYRTGNKLLGRDQKEMKE